MTVGDLFSTLEEQTKESHACFFGDESVKSLPNKVVVSRSNLDCSKAKPADATAKTLSFLSRHPKAAIRSSTRLQLLKLRAMMLKLKTALDLLVRYMDQQNYDRIMGDARSKVTRAYLDVVRVFLSKVGEINPDVYGKLKVIKALAEAQSKSEIIQGIFAVL